MLSNRGTREASGTQAHHPSANSSRLSAATGTHNEGACKSDAVKGTGMAVKAGVDCSVAAPVKRSLLICKSLAALRWPVMARMARAVCSSTLKETGSRSRHGPAQILSDLPDHQRELNGASRHADEERGSPLFFRGTMEPTPRIDEVLSPADMQEIRLLAAGTSIGRTTPRVDINTYRSAVERANRAERRLAGAEKRIGELMEQRDATNFMLNVKDGWIDAEERATERERKRSKRIFGWWVVAMVGHVAWLMTALVAVLLWKRGLL